MEQGTDERSEHEGMRSEKVEMMLDVVEMPERTNMTAEITQVVRENRTNILGSEPAHFGQFSAYCIILA